MSEGKENGSNGDSNNVGRKRKPGTFVKGDPRCWRHGRPKSFDAIRAMAQAIAHEPIETEEGKMTVAASVLRQWASSPEPTLQKAFIEYAFGKVPDKIEASIEEKKRLVLTYDEERERDCRIPSAEAQSAN